MARKKPTKKEVEAVRKAIETYVLQGIDQARLDKRIEEIKTTASRKQRQRLLPRRSLRDFIDGPKK